MKFKLTSAFRLLVTFALITGSAWGETISVPFGWKTGDKKIYKISSSTERLGDLKGGNCILSGILSVEVRKRETNKARIQMQLSDLKLNYDCQHASIRQLLWFQLSKQPIDAILEPASGNVDVENLEILLQRLKTAMRDAPIFFGHHFDQEIRLDIAKKVEQLLITKSKQLHELIGLFSPLITNIGETYDVGKIEVVSIEMPHPLFAEKPVPSKITFQTNFAKTSKGINKTELHFNQSQIYDSEALAEHLRVVVKSIAKDRATSAELNRLNQRKFELRTEFTIHFDRLSGWTKVSEMKSTSSLDKGLQIEVIKMVLQ